MNSTLRAAVVTVSAFAACGFAIAGAWTVAAQAPADPRQTQAPTLDQVLARMGAYLATYEEALLGVVAEERYQQELRAAAAVSGAPQATEHRLLVSDFALARFPADVAWMGLRDTFEVDGKPVRDREARLERLLSAGSTSAFAQAVAMTRENSRYNLGEDILRRTINVPTLVLGLIHARNRSRFSFRKNGEETIDGRRVWMIAYKERERPTIIRSVDGRDLQANGLAWVVAETGEILRTSLTAADGRADSSALIVVDYRREAKLEMLAPVRMSESYRRPQWVISAVATYSNFRRFQTSGRVVTDR